jgi:hypothetical protein
VSNIKDKKNMGRAKEYWMEQQETAAYEEKCEWIREHLGNDEAEEGAEGWYEAVEAYEEYLNQMHVDWESLRYENEYHDYWTVEGKTSFQIFNETIDHSKELMNIQVSDQAEKNLFVMLYGHIVASVEAYLSSTFIEKVTSLENQNYLRKLVETDPELGKRKFTLNEIFTKQEELNNEVKLYLRELIFHRIDKVKPMYKDVLDIDFGEDIEWLFQAVLLRHDCVHRAGYDKDCNEVDMSKEKVEELMTKCTNLVESIENKLNP